jgi:hypothetical protein
LPSSVWTSMEAITTSTALALAPRDKPELGYGACGGCWC